MQRHPVSVTTYSRMAEHPTDEEILLAYRLALVEANAKLHERTDAHFDTAGAVPTGPIHHTLVVLAAREVDCPSGGCIHG